MRRREEQNSETDISVFRVGFLEVKRKISDEREKDEHDEGNSSWELYDFIAEKHKMLFYEQQVDGNFNLMNIPAPAIDKLLGKLINVL